MWDQVGPKPIPVSEVESFLNISLITDPDERLKYLKFIQILDRVELEHLRSTMKKASSK